MSIPSPMQVFESAIEAPASSASAEMAQEVVREKLEAAHRIVMASDMPSMDMGHHDSISVLSNLGDYMARIASIAAKLAEDLATGDHINQAAREVHMQTKAQTRCADLRAVSAFDVELNKLRKMRDETAKYSQTLQAIWRPESQFSSGNALQQATMSPFVEMKPLSMQHSPTSPDDSKARVRRTLPEGLQKDQKPANDTGSGSEASEDADDEAFQQLNLSALSNRGKGNYTCPKGHKCTKGGVDKYGNLTNFERNSAFVQHCNKHRKPYRCYKEHCPNPPKKRRFARRDGLERHLNTVTHAPPSLDKMGSATVPVESG